MGLFSHQKLYSRAHRLSRGRGRVVEQREGRFTFSDHECFLEYGSRRAMLNDKGTLVSVVIPTYNRIQYLREAVDSVLNQTFANLEIIIVDDGSKDETSDYVGTLARRHNRIVFVRLEHTGVIAVVRNAGLRRARGTHVAFLDSDDLWRSDKTEKQLRAMQEYEADWVCSNAYVFEAEPRSAKTLLHAPRNFRSGNVTQRIILKYFVVSSSVMVRRDVIKSAGFFDETLQRCEDHEYFLRVSTTHKLAAMSEPLVYYRVHQSQKTVDPKEDLFRHTINSLNVFDSKVGGRYSAVGLKKSRLWTKVAIQQALRRDITYKQSIALARGEDASFWVSRCLYCVRQFGPFFRLVSRIINLLAR